MSSKSRGDVGEGVPFRIQPKSSRSSGGLSRRDFLRHAAVGAGALAIGGPAVAESLATVNEKLLCSRKTFFVPFLEIVTSDIGAGFFSSPDIWLTDTPKADAPPVTTVYPFTEYFAVARIHNRGSAPVFNAVVNFYVFLTFLVNPTLPSAFTRFNASSVHSQYASIQAHSDKLVLCSTPFTPFVETVLTYLVVECFDPLTDMIQLPPDGKFNLGNDRHLASVAFI